MSWPRQESQNTLDNPEFERKSWISWVWGFEVVHAKGSFEVALPPNSSVVVCTDHQSLQSWHKEHVDTPSGPAARSTRWHERFAEFHLSVV